MNLVNRFFLLLIYIYQNFFSPIIPKSCRFVPSCSSYAKEAIETHGIKGVWLSILRILHCQPFASCRQDEVPKDFSLWPRTKKIDHSGGTHL